MRVLIPVWFSSPNGGLHENVRFCCRAIRGAGGEAIVQCPHSPFTESLKSEGFEVAETDFVDVEAAIRQAEALGPFDLIHSHVGAGLRVAEALARAAGTPMLMTVHGRSGGRHFQFADVISLMFCVSPAIVERFEKAKNGQMLGRVTHLPNAVDVERFSPGEMRPQGRVMRIIVPSRFRQDKREMLRVLPALWEAQSTSRRPRSVQWTLVGEGEELPGLLDKAKALEALCGPGFVSAKGWMNAEALEAEVRQHDLAVAPGRSAMEAMAAGLPTVALGSAGCVGLMDEAGLKRGQWCNFGGYGTVGIGPEEAWKDIARMKRSPEERRRIGLLGSSFVKEHYDHRVVAAQLIGHYQDVLRAPRRAH